MIEMELPGLMKIGVHGEQGFSHCKEQILTDVRTSIFIIQLKVILTVVLNVLILFITSLYNTEILVKNILMLLLITQLIILLLMGKLTGDKIKTVALYAGCLLLSLKMSGQQISLKNVKLENILRAKFYFEVANSSDSIKVYSVSLEKCGDDNSWY